MNLTWKEVFTRANVLPSTATSQRERFAEFFSYSGKGRQRRYSEESVEVLKLISSMYSDGKDFETIREELERSFFVPTSITTTNDDESTTMQPSQLDLINSIREMVRTELSDKDEAILRLEEKLAENTRLVNTLISDAKARDENTIDRDRKLTESLRILQEARQQQASKKWWQIFR